MEGQNDGSYEEKVTTAPYEKPVIGNYVLREIAPGAALHYLIIVFIHCTATTELALHRQREATILAVVQTLELCALSVAVLTLYGYLEYFFRFAYDGKQMSDIKNSRGIFLNISMAHYPALFLSFRIVIRPGLEGCMKYIFLVHFSEIRRLLRDQNGLSAPLTIAHIDIINIFVLQNLLATTGIQQ